MDRQQFLNWCITKRGLGKNSLRHTRLRYEYLFRWLVNRPLTSDSCETFILYLREKGLRNASINSYIRVVNLIDIFERENGNDLNLLRKISYFPKQKRIPTILSVKDIERLYDVEMGYKKRFLALHNDLYDVNTTYALVFLMLASTGARIEEILTLKREHLHLSENTYIKLIDTKTLEDRMVPIPPVLADKLTPYVKEKKPTDFVFTSSTGRKISAQLIEVDMIRRGEKAGMTVHLYPHTLRNSYIMEHIRRGTQILTLATLVGQTPNTTIGYTKYNYDDLIKGAENHPLFAKTIPPDRLLIKVKTAIEGFRLFEDPRFNFKITERNDSLTFTLSVK